MMPLSGAFFTMDMLPGPIRAGFLFVPLAHIFEILRYGWFYSATDEYFSVPYHDRVAAEHHAHRD